MTGKRARAAKFRLQQALADLALRIEMEKIKAANDANGTTRIMRTRENAESCAACGKKIKAGKPVVRKRIDWDGTFGKRHTVAPCCTKCSYANSSRKKPCEGCGRDVYQMVRIIPSRTFCCERC